MLGNCARFGDVSGDWGYREREGLEKERECCRAVWRRTGWRKESYNVGVPTILLNVVTYTAISEWKRGCFYYVFVHN